jgi:hypothetical protein
MKLSQATRVFRICQIPSFSRTFCGLRFSWACRFPLPFLFSLVDLNLANGDDGLENMV